MATEKTICHYCSKEFSTKQMLYYHIKRNVCNGNIMEEKDKEILRLKNAMDELLNETNNIVYDKEDMKRQNRWVNFLSRWSAHHKFPYGAILNQKVLPYVKEDYKNDVMGDYSKLDIEIEREEEKKEEETLKEQVEKMIEELKNVNQMFQKESTSTKDMDLFDRNRFIRTRSNISMIFGYLDELKRPDIDEYEIIPKIKAEVIQLIPKMEEKYNSILSSLFDRYEEKVKKERMEIYEKEQRDFEEKYGLPDMKEDIFDRYKKYWRIDKYNSINGIEARYKDRAMKMQSIKNSILDENNKSNRLTKSRQQLFFSIKQWSNKDEINSILEKMSPKLRESYNNWFSVTFKNK